MRPNFSPFPLACVRTRAILIPNRDEQHGNRHNSNETRTLSNDANVEHPEWVHRQLGTDGEESSLQQALSNYNPEDYAGGEPDADGVSLCGEGFDERPLTELVEDSERHGQAFTYRLPKTHIEAAADHLRDLAIKAELDYDYAEQDGVIDFWTFDEDDDSETMIWRITLEAA